ncbi:hypothetical protein T08_3773 [Trichinella sp. T8]|nr:hypothetical protein T08_3773 [Trichinella sp. T8]
MVLNAGSGQRILACHAFWAVQRPGYLSAAHGDLPERAGWIQVLGLPRRCD